MMLLDQQHEQRQLGPARPAGAARVRHFTTWFYAQLAEKRGEKHAPADYNYAHVQRWTKDVRIAPRVLSC
jgi:Ulp1 family protease